MKIKNEHTNLFNCPSKSKNTLEHWPTRQNHTPAATDITELIAQSYFSATESLEAAVLLRYIRMSLLGNTHPTHSNLPAHMDSLSFMLLLSAVPIGVVVFFYFVPVNLWVTALFSGVRVGLFELVFMRIRKVPPRIIVNSLITATKAGLKVTTSE